VWRLLGLRTARRYGGAAVAAVSHDAVNRQVLAAFRPDLDPDGNMVLLGQRERSASQAPAEDDGQIRFSILQEAAALVSSRGGAQQACQDGGPGNGRCPNQAEVKLADSLGTARGSA
jgi:hypothetical protein